VFPFGVSVGPDRPLDVRKPRTATRPGLPGW
jgi:hypothetical protein